MKVIRYHSKLLRPLLAWLLVISIVPAIRAATQDGLSLPDNSVTNQVHPYDWPGFLGADRNGRSNERGIIKDWTAGKLKVVWKRKIGTGYSLGSTSQGKYFQLDATGNTCRLVCLEELTGRQIWKFEYEFQYNDMYGFDNGPRSTPLVDGERVYIFGVAGMLHCLDTRNGDVVWKLDTTKKFGVVQNFFGVGSSPIILGDKLIVMIGGSPPGDQAKGSQLDEVGPNGTGIVIFDKKTGQVIHQFIDDLASYASINLYRENGRDFAVAWMRTNAFGIDLENGKQLWKYPFRARKYESVNASTPVVQGTQILLSESYGPGAVLLDVQSQTPKVIWKDKNIRERALATHWNTPVYHQGHVYACNGERRSNTDIRCVDWKTGEVKWKQSGFGRSSLTYVDNHLIVLDESGELFLIAADSSEYRRVTEYRDSEGKKLPLKYPCWAAPVVSNGLLFVRGKDELICLKLKP